MSRIEHGWRVYLKKKLAEIQQTGQGNTLIIGHFFVMLSVLTFTFLEESPDVPTCPAEVPRLLLASISDEAISVLAHPANATVLQVLSRSELLNIASRPLPIGSTSGSFTPNTLFEARLTRVLTGINPNDNNPCHPLVHNFMCEQLLTKSLKLYSPSISPPFAFSVATSICNSPSPESSASESSPKSKSLFNSISPKDPKIWQTIGLHSLHHHSHRTFCLSQWRLSQQLLVFRAVL